MEEDLVASIEKDIAHQTIPFERIPTMEEFKCMLSLFELYHDKITAAYMYERMAQYLNKKILNSKMKYYSDQQFIKALQCSQTTNHCFPTPSTSSSGANYSYAASSLGFVQPRPPAFEVDSRMYSPIKDSRMVENIDQPIVSSNLPKETTLKKSQHLSASSNVTQENMDSPRRTKTKRRACVEDSTDSESEKELVLPQRKVTKTLYVSVQDCGRNIRNKHQSNQSSDEISCSPVRKRSKKEAKPKTQSVSKNNPPKISAKTNELPQRNNDSKVEKVNQKSKVAPKNKKSNTKVDQSLKNKKNEPKVVKVNKMKEVPCISEKKKKEDSSQKMKTKIRDETAISKGSSRFLDALDELTTWYESTDHPEDLVETPKKKKPAPTKKKSKTSETKTKVSKNVKKDNKNTKPKSTKNQPPKKEKEMSLKAKLDAASKSKKDKRNDSFLTDSDGDISANESLSEISVEGCMRSVLAKSFHSTGSITPVPMEIQEIKKGWVGIGKISDSEGLPSPVNKKNLDKNKNIGKRLTKTKKTSDPLKNITNLPKSNPTVASIMDAITSKTHKSTPKAVRKAFQKNNSDSEIDESSDSD